MSELDSIRIMIDSNDTKRENIQINQTICIKEWKDHTKNEKILFIIYLMTKLAFLLLLLYLFLISLELISIGTILITPDFLKFENVFKHLFSNPVTALFFGILTTSILQNAAATTSIVITMVGTGLISSVKNAIPVIMGSNIGTCITSSYVALTLSRNSLSLGRAFAAATLNDMFNILTTLILFPAEIFFNALSSISLQMVEKINFDEKNLFKQLNFIGKIQTPITNILIKVDKEKFNLLKNRTFNKNESQLISFALKYCDENVSNFTKECNYLTMPLIKSYGETTTGLIILITSTLFLLIIFFCIVKVLNMMIVGPIALYVRKSLNANFSGKFTWLMYLIIFLMAFILTLFVQSSNIVTATLVPLCGIGIVSLQRVYVMIMGSNVGTTITGILSAFSQPGYALKKSLQLAFVYTLFNMFGILIWLPIPFMQIPKKIAIHLGNLAYNHHWFILSYISLLYYIIPIIVLSLSLISFNYKIIIILVILIVCFKIFLIYILVVKYCFEILPIKLKRFFKFKPNKKININKRPYESRYSRVLRRLSSVDLS